MSDTAQLALIAMIGSTLALAIGGWFKLKTMERRADREAMKREADAKHRDKKLDEINVLVDGNLTELLKRVAKLTQFAADDDPQNVEKAADAKEAADVVVRKEATDAQAHKIAVRPVDKPKGEL
jgi:hypothetical protein